MEILNAGIISAPKDKSFDTASCRKTLSTIHIQPKNKLGIFNCPSPVLKMSVAELETSSSQLKRRKRDSDEAEIEIDVDAPEPPSKKALRKAKKAKLSTDSQSLETEAARLNSTARQDESREGNKRSEHGIWIGNLAFSTTKEDLLKFLTMDTKGPIQPQKITRIHLPQGPAKFGRPQNKGFAYIDFSHENCIQAALEMSESMLTGRRVLIKNAKSFEGRPEQKNEQNGNSKLPPSRRIFIGNLDFATTVEELEAHFRICGTIANTHMATFEDSGKCKGYAWVEFEQISSAEKAMRGWVEADASTKDSSHRRIWLNKIQGRKLRMEYAEDKAIRYEKRFGKNAKKAAAVSPEETGSRGGNDVEGNHRGPEKKPKMSGKYSRETVQRLTGAMVESTGQKNVFD